MQEILQKLVEIPTVTRDFAANHQAIEYIAQFLETRGMYINRHKWNGFESLVATTHPTQTPEIFLVGHIDVVPGDKSQFHLTQKDNKLYGRGVFDMKFALAAYLHLVDQLQDTLTDYDFGIMISSDEEVGGHHGVKKLIQAGYLPKAAVIPDGGANWAVEIFAKGISWFTITAHGKSTHSSRPWEGDNAFEKLTEILGEIKNLFAEQDPSTSTLNIAQVHSGEATNQVPDKATAHLDVRTASLEDKEEIANAIQAICRAYGADLEIPLADPPCINDPKNPYIARFMQDIETITGYPSSTTVAMAGSDGRFFSEAGVPCIITYPPGGGHHGAGEWISREGFEQFYKILYRYINRVALAKKEVAAARTITGQQ